MASTDNKRKLTSMALFATPLAMVFAAKLYFAGSGPQAVQATPVEQVATDKKKKPIVAPTYTARQRAAAERIASIRAEAIGPCPFLYEPRTTPTSTTTSTPTDPVPVSNNYVEPAIPKFTAQAILSSSTGKTALIDGKPTKEGQKVRGTQWEVVTIDAESRSVTLREAAGNGGVGRGRTITIQVETPTLTSPE
jgi:hypothetical protein